MKKNNKVAHYIIKGLDSGINLCLLVIFLLLLLYGSYAIWDAEQVYKASATTNYEVYKPKMKENKSFKELQTINPDVFGWITVYGTGIDYPLVQGENNEKYVSTDVEGKYSMGGSLFLDYRNARDFSDFNSIIFGHHMEKSKMFGDLELFFDKKFFREHPYGNVYYDGKDHGIEFFAFMQIDAFDSSIFNTPVVGVPTKEDYLKNIAKKSMHQRKIPVTSQDHLILLSTCTENTTNGRHILIGKISDQTFPDTTKKDNEAKKYTANFQSDSLLKRLKQYGWWLGLLLFLLLLLILSLIFIRKKGHNNQRKDGENESEKPVK